MKYQCWYDQIIDRARGRKLVGYKERHHIVPRACGGTDHDDNLVDLTYREHFLVHWLLVKTTAGKNRLLMAFALHCMTMSSRGRIISSWQYEMAKRPLRREYLVRATARVYQRRLAWKEYLRETADRSANAEREALRLDPSNGKDRQRLKLLTNDWIGGDLRRGRRRAQRSGNANIRAKNILAEAGVKL